MFLPDRYVRGTCPVCSTPDQYGDSCENCGATYSPLELKDAVSAALRNASDSSRIRSSVLQAQRFRGRAPRLGTAARRREHGAQARRMVRGGAQGLGHLARRAVFRLRDPRRARQVLSMSGSMLRSATWRAFSRSAAARASISTSYWGPDSSAELYHFIGKDILYFHTCSGRPMLEGAGYRKPSGVFVHGFLTVDGQKMSKRRGTFITMANLREARRPRLLALLLRRQARSRRRRHRPEPRGSRRQGQRRSRRQARQHRKPLRGLHPQRSTAGGSPKRSRRGALRRHSQTRPTRSRADYESRRLRARHAARSWRWPTAPTNTSTSTSHGLRRKTPLAVRRCSTSARSASISFVH